MPVLTVGRNGTGMSAGGVGSHERAKRSVITGLSAAAARRQLRFLQSVNGDELDGLGMAVTLTLRDLPASPQELHELLENFADVCRRRGMTCGHWVIELQKRGVPHYHLALYFQGREDDFTQLRRELVTAWVRIASEYGAKRVGQHVERIIEGTGWAKYCAKHAGRSVKHSQRVGMPAGWPTSGRLWGKWGEWPTDEVPILVDSRTYVELRRLLRAWRHADAKRALRAAEASLRAAHTDDWRRTAEHHVRVATARVRSTRRFYAPRGDTLQETQRLSRSVGMREWVPMSVMFDLLYLLESTAGRGRRTWKTGREDLSAGEQPWSWQPYVTELQEYDEDGCEILSDAA
jgi:hypothetical protein